MWTAISTVTNGKEAELMFLMIQDAVSIYKRWEDIHLFLSTNMGFSGVSALRKKGWNLNWTSLWTGRKTTSCLLVADNGTKNVINSSANPSNQRFSLQKQTICHSKTAKHHFICCVWVSVPLSSHTKCV